MRFTKIPLIATLMAVALSLLIVLPALGQAQDYDDTLGTLKSGELTVDVLTGATETVGGNQVPVVAGSKFNRNLYVSNAEGAYNEVRITATVAREWEEFAGADGEKDNRLNAAGDTPEDDTTTDLVNEANYANDNYACAGKATVRNNNSGRSITVYLTDPAGVTTFPTLTDTTAAALNAVFQVTTSGDQRENGACESATRGGSASDSSAVTSGTISGGDAVYADVPATVGPVPGMIPARHGDTLTVTVAGLQGSVILTVDAEGPEFSEISPEHKASLSSQTVNFRFVVSDADSGLAHDGELVDSTDTDPQAVNEDNDPNTTSEPRSTTTGSARDIQVMLDGSDQSVAGSNGWRQRGARPGVSYFLGMAVTNVSQGPRAWYLQAKDRAGNIARTDADPAESGDDDFILTVDVSSPEFGTARTGISYDPDKKKEIVDRFSIALTFEDMRGPDALSAVDADKFRVEDAEVVGFIHLADASDCDDEPLDIDGQCIRPEQKPRSRVYLQLAEALAPDAEPKVEMFGGAVLDLAGNPSNQHEIDASDNIAPAVTVTLATDVTDRPVIRSNGEVTVSITSDEDLRRLPTVYFAPIQHQSTDDDGVVKVELGTERRGDRVQTDSGAENAWSRAYSSGDVGASDNLYAVIVIAEDDNDNIGATPGWKRNRKDNAPDGNDATLADLAAAGLLVEIDTDANAGNDPVFSLSPEADDMKTESANPFITIDFSAEKGEYGKQFKGDSHSAVEITSITLNGDDVMGHTSAVTDNTYTLAARDLPTDDYELKVTGRDDVGNEVSGTYEFEVAARAPYKLGLTPGWNLVSVPGTPLDSSVQSVMGDSMNASIVLAYQDDAWLTAVNDNGTWRGTLTDIVGGYGYWVQTTAFESISALIPETDTSSVLPTASVIRGWNLLGVVDVLQAPTKEDTCVAPSGGSEADDYFGNFDWKVAYSFDTSNNTWDKAIEGSEAAADATADEICNGKGYWVWSTEAGTLVP